MLRRLVPAALLCGVLVTVATSGDAGAGTMPTADACPDRPSTIRAAPGDPAGSTEETKGTQGPDTILGTDGVDWIDGRGGADCVDGGAGDDLLSDGTRGAAEQDTIIGGAGHDTIRLANGDDGVVSGDGDDVIDAGNGRTDFIDCGAGNDVVRADIDDRTRDCERTRAATNRVRRVEPRSGRAATRFLVRFRRPLIVDESNENSFTIALTPPRNTPCAAAGRREYWDSTALPLGRAIRSVRLRGPGRSHRWCRGRWECEVIETFVRASSSCDSGDTNPFTCSGDSRIGAFRFRVR